MKLKVLLMGLVCLGLAACGKQLDGRFEDKLGVQSYEFKSGGKVYVSTVGFTQEAQYKVEDGKVKIGKGDGSELILDLKDDNTLIGPLGIELKKASK